MVIGHQAHCLVAARWEEGWERPISDPADGEAYGLAV
jgi:ubiquinone biosynthesis protein Coq4